MYAKCVECKLVWNISIKAEIRKDGYKCPKCRAKAAAKTTQHKKNKVSLSKTLLKK
jgi:ssDNA-binding Zn-finger/Zn-ribbon topoisomerase 1